MPSTTPGFISYALLELGNGALATVSVFETQADEEESDRLPAAWVAAHPTPLAAPADALRGEVLVQKGMWPTVAPVSGLFNPPTLSGETGSSSCRPRCADGPGGRRADADDHRGDGGFGAAPAGGWSGSWPR
ncbi:MAG: hypothetical protein JO023_13335 [Chloroflexi bacterium]|nr:hypothetical protein [Chloroflexota bacterium]